MCHTSDISKPLYPPLRKPRGFAGTLGASGRLHMAVLGQRKGLGLQMALALPLNFQNMSNSSNTSVGEGSSVHLEAGLETRGRS